MTIEGSYNLWKVVASHGVLSPFQVYKIMITDPNDGQVMEKWMWYFEIK